MFGVVPKTLWEKKRAGRRAQPHHAGHAAAASSRGARDDDHRRRARRQDGREVRRHLRRRRAATPGSHPGARRDCPRTTSTSSSPRTCTSIMPAASRCATRPARVRPRFPRAGTWSGAASGRTRRIRTSATAPAISLTTTCRCRCGRPAAGGRRPDDHAGGEGSSNGRSHDAPPDGPDRRELRRDRARDPAAAALARAGARADPRGRVRRGDARIDPAPQGRAVAQKRQTATSRAKRAAASVS